MHLLSRASLRESSISCLLAYRIARASLLAAAFFGAATAVAAVDTRGGPPAADIMTATPHHPQRVLVRFRAGLSDFEMEGAAARHGARVLRRLPVPRTRPAAMRQWHVLQLAQGIGVRQALQRLAADPAVEWAEPDYLVSYRALPNDPKFGSQWGLHNTGQSGGTIDADIDAPEAWDLEAGSGAVVVAVVDTGIDYAHVDLADNIWLNGGEIPGNGVDDDGNGYVDDMHGYDFANGDADPMDDEGHGTHVAGTIGARGGNGLGVAGVGWYTSVMALKFLRADGTGFVSDAVSAIHYALDQGVKVINASWGGAGYSQALKDAIANADAAGALFIAAAGNGGTDNVGDDNDALPFYPASYDVPNIIAVAATDRNDARGAFSNYGAVSVDLGAPGVSIQSTVPGNGYGLASGTSMAAPHVAGAAALVFARLPGIAHGDVRFRLLAHVDPVPALAGITATGGRLNLFRAIEDATPPAPVTDLAVAAVGTHTVTLAWSATGDDGALGTAAAYDLRYSNAPIDAANFAAATPVAGPPAPLPPGSTESFKVLGLDPATTYYFALAVYDGDRNASVPSNVVTAATRAAQVLFSDDLEAGGGNWTIAGSDGVGGPALWHIVEERYRGKVINRLFYYGIDSRNDYDTGARNYGTITSVLIDLTWMSDAWLAFTHLLGTENQPPFDTARVQVSGDGGQSWQDVFASALGTAGATLAQGVDLAAFAGQVIQLRFTFDTLNALANNFAGWRVDDVVVSAAPRDTDGDGVPDMADDCTLAANPGQRDTDGDGYGNVCDADLNNDGIVNTLDFGLFRQAFGTAGPDLDADFNGDAVVNTLDFGMFRQMYGRPPGPSGLHP